MSARVLIKIEVHDSVCECVFAVVIVSLPAVLFCLSGCSRVAESTTTSATMSVISSFNVSPGRANVLLCVHRLQLLMVTSRPRFSKYLTGFIT